MCVTICTRVCTNVPKVCTYMYVYTYIQYIYICTVCLVRANIHMYCTVLYLPVHEMCTNVAGKVETLHSLQSRFYDVSFFLTRTQRQHILVHVTSQNPGFKLRLAPPPPPPYPRDKTTQDPPLCRRRVIMKKFTKFAKYFVENF